MTDETDEQKAREVLSGIAWNGVTYPYERLVVRVAEALKAERDAANDLLRRAAEVFNRLCQISHYNPCGHCEPCKLRAAIDAHLKQELSQVNNPNWTNTETGTPASISVTQPGAEQGSGLSPEHCPGDGCPGCVHCRSTHSEKSDAVQPKREEHPDTARFNEVESRRWCIVPPNQETPQWSIYRDFDGEFGYNNLISTGDTLREAIDRAREAEHAKD